MRKYSGIFALILILLLLPTVLGVADTDAQGTPQGESILRLSIPSPDEYAYASRTIPGLTVNNSVIEFHISAMISRYQSTAPAVLLQVDLQGTGQTTQAPELRYSFRFASDGSVIFYYPFMDSSAAVTKQKGWALGKWCRLSTIVGKDSAKFYMDGQLVAENDPKNPARSEGFVLSHFGFGKPERQRLNVEAFVGEASLIQDGITKFSERFGNDLGAYQVRKSQKAVLQVIDPLRYTSIEAHATPQTASVGDAILFRANLFDIYFKGVGNKPISLEHPAGDRCLRLAEAQSLDNGTARALWRAPPNFKGEISVRAHFMGDDNLSEAISAPFTLMVVPQTATGFETANITLALVGLSVVASALLSSRFGIVKVLHSLIPILCSLTFFFSIPILTSSVAITAHIAYAPRAIRLQIFGQQIDNLLWTLSIMMLAGAWILLHNRAFLHRRSALLPTLPMVASLVAQALGMGLTRALMGILSTMAIIFYPLVRGDSVAPSKPADFALRFSAVFLAIVSAIEIGSIGGWVYNAFDPHVPFDGEPRWLVASLEANLFGLLYPITLPALMILMFSWIWVPAVRFFVRSVTKRTNPSTTGETSEGHRIDLEVAQSGNVKMKNEDETRYMPSRGSKYLMYSTILAVVFCSIFLVYYPYFYATRLIGVDTPWYYKNLVAMSNPEGLSRLLSDYGAASRMPYLLILYVIQSVTALPPMFVVKLGPAVPAAFMGISTFFLIRTITRDTILASFSAFLGLFSIATTVAVYAGIFANWLALGWVALFLGLLLRAWSRPSPMRVLAATLVSIVILLTHAWTWGVVLASLMVFVGFSMLYRLAARCSLIPSWTLRVSLPIIVANLVLLLLVMSLLSRGEFMILSRSALEAVNPGNLKSFHPALLFTFQYYVGGFFANPVVILPAIVGVVKSRRIDGKLSLLVFSLLLVTSIPLLLVGSWWQWRLLYMVPYQVLAAFSVAGVSRKATGSNGRLFGFCGALLMLVILLASLNYSLRCLNYIPS